MIRNGDDLEDDFELDELVALSDGEQEPLDVEDEFVPDEPENLDAGVPVKPVPSTVEAATSKKRKRREKEKERKKRKLAEIKDTVEQTVAFQSPESLASYLAGMQKKTFKDMSEIELEDMRLPATALADTSIWKGPRTLDALVDFIIKALPTLKTRLSQRPKTTGAPTLLFVTSAALRVADAARILKDKRLRGDKGGEVAKLFAKHIKLAEHVTYLRRTKVTAAPGTPGRIGKLLCETESISVAQLSHIILDITYRDSKNRNLLDIPETRDEVFKTVLGAPMVLKAIKEGKTQVVLF
ncbi:U3-containing 90S pre-ribosomal complex subunit-domain containing protein [Coprinopsis sp. MPI-PUGE-AT-0042]|nr:U3-containing 90S pre-ribosomal complex subunit-domain containing protein [Coprinopsis sp. MPI-PUGE-AT-0042]